MKSNCLLITLVVGCAAGPMHGPLHAQGRVLSSTQIEAIVRAELSHCSTQVGQRQRSGIDPAHIIPTRNAREFPRERVARTLHGMWRGRVVGDTRDVSVDYFWLIDTSRGEALLIAQRTGRQTLAALRPVENAPRFAYLLCATEGYVPDNDTPQMHEFTKVSNSLEDAPRVLQAATGQRLPEARRGLLNMLRLRRAQPNLSDLWRSLVASRYFETVPSVAYAGGFFKPMQIQPVASATGPTQVEIKWNAEYRGGGATTLQFTRGVPIHGVEHALFVGTTTNSGDFLVASPGNGRMWKVEAFSGAIYDLAFDKVVLGPLQ